MGKFGFSKVEVSFLGEIPEEFTTKEKLIDALEIFKGGDYSITDFNIYKDSIYFEMSSGRIQNLEWQVGALGEYIKAKKLPYLEVSASGYIESDSGSLYLNSDED